MRRTFIAGNWKMNTHVGEQQSLIDGIYQDVNHCNVELAVCPPFVYLSSVIEYTKSKENQKKIGLKVGAQNMHWEDKGAFTGEISGSMLKDIGCTYVILGHSERRTLFGETNQNVNLKLHKSLSLGLLPIVCIGETLAERESGAEQDIIAKQLKESLAGLAPAQIETCTIAYEPVWAIGTGKTASPEMAQEMHRFIRQFLAENYNSSVSDAVRIQYGGSVQPENIQDLIAQPDIDGALIGGASLKPASFAKIINACA